jgi:hypothetical protein
LRPHDQENVRALSGSDEITPRESMEASENAGPRRQGGGGPSLHRIDPERVAETLSTYGNQAGFARLSLMVNTIFDRLVAQPGEGRS